MREIKAEKLSLQSYHPFGEFADLLEPEGEFIGSGEVFFYRDMVSVYTGSVMTAFSIVQTANREMIPVEAEQHKAGTEILLPLDDDIVIFVAPASDGYYPAGKEKAFIVPKGMMVTIKPGVWHKAPFPVNKEKANTLVILPEREYALDCIVEKIGEDQRFRVIV